MEEKELPFAGVNCDLKDKKSCKVWWLATIKDKVHSVRLDLDQYDIVKLLGGLPTNDTTAEIELEEKLRNTKMVLE